MWHLLAVSALLTACELRYPQVVIKNDTAINVLIKNPSFSGCVWNVVLAYGESTAPARCLPGDDSVHFQKLDLDDPCHGSTPGNCQTSPYWFNYKLSASQHVDYDQAHTFSITLDTIEQDFSLPGPFGH